ncbi:unnamed protein product [Sphenostylis stenocarpa]|uniref:Fe2OG dioxygenase domain-containing protein n=1 Tax=Sphenostylis stenocarpa TaxID=92480 RepID=A0AA86SZD0_9FABA|nr:unnamed protein product [Sphenostylis stenocarpa]
MTLTTDHRVRESIYEANFLLLVGSISLSTFQARVMVFCGAKDCRRELKRLNKAAAHQFKALSSYRGINFMDIQYESFGIHDLPLSAAVETFTNLMWPQGNPHLCETLKCMSLKINGLSQHYVSDAENMKSCSHIRFKKYKASSNNKDADPPSAHTDKNTLTFLCENGVQGLQVLTKTGKWIEIEIPQDGFVVMVGDTLKAWSNGRLHAASHIVVLSGDKERYTRFGIFMVPKDKMDVEPSEADFLGS